MDFDEYSKKAAHTDQTNFTKSEKLQFLALGLNEEVGEIARLIKKSMRNDISIEAMKTELKRKLGDVLWYLSRFGNEAGLVFSDIAESNIDYINKRWLFVSTDHLAPAHQPALAENENENFPGALLLEFKREVIDGLIKLRLVTLDGSQVGDVIDDNSYKDDGYRFHDVIHLALMAYLGWSPVLRKLLKNKRKSAPVVDRVEDGARARDIEEATSILIFNYMQGNNFLENAAAVDTSFLTTLRSVCHDREIAHVTERAWELAMLDAAHIIRQLKQYGQGYVIADNISKKLTFKQEPPVDRD